MEPEIINDVGDVGINGWPLGLPPVNARLSAASTSNVIVSSSCSPSTSSTSSSSSAFDSESTTSFFPERSTTLGSLIGIHSSSQFTLVHDNSSSADERHTGRGGRNRILRSFLSCGRGLHEEDCLEVSPSISHLVEMGGGSSRSSLRQYLEEQGRDNIGIDEEDEEGLAVHSNERRWTRSHSCGPSLEIMLQQRRSPLSPWDEGASGSRLHSFWHGFCGKLSSSLAT